MTSKDSRWRSTHTNVCVCVCVCVNEACTHTLYMEERGLLLPRSGFVLECPRPEMLTLSLSVVGTASYSPQPFL